MSAIIEGSLIISNQRVGDLLDITFDIEGINLTGKILLCQCRASAGNPVILEFKESDGSLIKTIVSTTKTTVQFLKHAHQMNIQPITYYLTIISYTNIDDVTTIISGTLTMVRQITILP